MAKRSVRVTGERGVSDVVGFVLIFSLILLAVGVIYTTGIAGLQDARDAERIDNAEMAFDILQSNGADIFYHGAPSRVTVIKLSNAQLGPGDPVTINLSTGDNGTSTGNITIRPLVYTADDTKLVYVNGAVLRQDNDDAVMLEQPSFHFGHDGRSLVPIFETRFPEPTTIGGQTRARVRMTVSDESFRGATVLRPADGNVTMTMTTPRPEPWRRYFERSSGVSCRGVPADGTVECTINDTVVVSDTYITVDVS